MILRAASIALALFLAAPLAIAQDAGDDDILNPGVLDRGSQTTTPPTRTQTPTTGSDTRPSTQSNQAGAANRDATDDDILGIGTGGSERALESTVAPTIKEPPAQTKAAIDAEVEAIGARAEAYSEERNRLDTLARTDPDRAESEVRAAISESDAEFDRIFDAASREGAADEVDEVSRALEGRGASTTTGARTTTGSVWDSPEMRANRDRYLGSSSSSYGDPYGMYSSNGYEPIGYPNAGTPDSRMSWWQKLMLKSLEGVAEGVKGLMERRANELKRREEKLRRDYPDHRAYVEAATRSRIERTAFAKYGNSGGGGVYDRRLDDLILGPARSGGLTASSGSTATSSPSTGGDLRARASDVRTGTPRGPVVPLKRVPDPVTGEPRIEIDMRLGEDPIRPIR